ncbi:hypothetical protein SAMN05216436_13520 [bacterium A37T11]|nr:hypothetical protein SAMN05216436_13520 [bacterium A37T11]
MKRKQKNLPTMGMENESPEWAKMEAFERELRWMRVLNWLGWAPLMAVVQLLGLLALFLWSGPLIRWFDPGAGVIDAGAISPCLLALLVVNLCAVSAWLLLRLIREGLTGFYEWDNELDGFTNKLPVCLRAKILTVGYFILLLLAVGLFWVLV